MDEFRSHGLKIPASLFQLFLQLKSDTDLKGDKREGHLYIFHLKYNGKLSDLALGEGAGFGFFARSEMDDIRIKEPDLSIIKEFYQSRKL